MPTLDPASCIARHGRHQVLAHATLVLFADNTALELHTVQATHHSTPSGTPHPEPMLRALRIGPHGWGLLDVRTLARTLDEDLRALHERDVPGMLALTLRATYPHATACRARAHANLKASWEAAPPHPHPSPVAQQLIRRVQVAQKAPPARHQAAPAPQPTPNLPHAA